MQGVVSYFSVEQIPERLVPIGCRLFVSFLIFSTKDQLKISHGSVNSCHMCLRQFDWCC